MELQYALIGLDGLQSLFDELARRGCDVVGPTVRDGAIVYEPIDRVSALPKGWTDEQDGGHYRLVPREDDALFGYAVGPHSWKQFLHPPRQRLWHAVRDEETVRVTPEPLTERRYAFIGVRACELAAIAIQDRVLMGGAHADPHYEARRRRAFIVALNCSHAAGTCFCVSMGAGPEVGQGFDLSLTELLDGERHEFLIGAGSDEGREVLTALPQREASAADIAAARAVVERTAGSMGREMRSDDLRELLQRNLEHPRWQDVADRCLTCGNCTMVCPTCFCTTVEDASDLTGTQYSREQRWDSCFTMDFSHVHGASVRASPRSRYRQWMTHKLSTWHDQFGTSGCVGCGRCIAWCPVGIDITEEVRAIRATETPKEEAHE